MHLIQELTIVIYKKNKNLPAKSLHFMFAHKYTFDQKLYVLMCYMTSWVLKLFILDKMLAFCDS